MTAGRGGRWRGSSYRSVHRSGSKAHKAASTARIREAIARGEEILDRNGASLTTGKTIARDISPHEVTPVGRVFAEVLDAALDGLLAAARDVIGPDAVEHAPLLTAESMKRAGRTGGDQGGTPGELRASMRVEEDRENQRVKISFNTIYAALQHERMNWKHTDGQAKFLELAMIRKRKETLEVIAEHVREVVGD